MPEILATAGIATCVWGWLKGRESAEKEKP